MLDANQVEELICIVSAMDREAVTEKLLSFQASFRVDFTNNFLDQLPEDRLRHILVALCLQASRLPSQELVAAA